MGCVAIVGIVVVGTIVLALVGFGHAIERGYLPDTLAIPGEKLQPRVIRLLRQEGIVDQDEAVLYFYSAGLLSFLEDGNLFTDRRVISYTESMDVEGEVQVFSATYPEITKIEPDWSDSFFEDSVLTVHTEAHQFILWVSTERERDRAFYNRLIETWNANR